jgi:hypothetical protein
MIYLPAVTWLFAHVRNDFTELLTQFNNVCCSHVLAASCQVVICSYALCVSGLTQFEKHWVFVATAAISASKVEGVRVADAQLPTAGSPGSIAAKFYDEMHSHQVFETGPTGVPVAVNEAWWQAHISGVPYEVFVASGKTFSTSGTYQWRALRSVRSIGQNVLYFGGLYAGLAAPAILKQLQSSAGTNNLLVSPTIFIGLWVAAFSTSVQTIRD